MPSVLAEIGFLTNSGDEALLKKPAYRQKIAEGLYNGIAKYASSLSHFQVAKAQ
ncbi:MAG: N-acetylmuramoyl-L-alanine amidase family protein [Bryobacteraceae bacterium]